MRATRGAISPIATGLAGLAVGAAVGAGYVASRKLGGAPAQAPAEEKKP